jgi:DNA polymerase III delta prime subunit
MNSNVDIWTFKYQPQTFDDVILNDDIRKKLSKAMVEVPNLMLVGPAGVGKGTFTHVFLKQTGLDYLWVNCSDETSIDNVRTKVKSFATSLGITPLKVVILNECLEENEEIIIGTTDNQRPVSMKSLPNGEFDIVSYNIERGCLENDKAIVVSDKVDELYEIELDDGRKIKATSEHPFLVRRNSEELFVKLKDLTNDDKLMSLNKNSKIKNIKQIGKGRVINIQVNKNHTFITKNGIITHNCDYLSVPAQAMMRDLMEQVQKITRFILMCNYGNKVIPELQSRCQVIEMGNPPLKDIAKFVMTILKQERVSVDKVEVIIDTVKKLYPDIRSTINTLQLNSSNGHITSVKLENTNSVYEKILKLAINTDLDGIRKEIRSNSINYVDLYSYMFDNVDKMKNPGDAIIEISEALYRDSMVAVKEINLIGCILKLLKKGCL